MTDPRAQTRPPVLATVGLVGLLLFAWGIQEALEARTDPLEMIALGASSPVLVGDGELHRLLANQLWHSGPVHLAINLAVLALLGALVERRIGTAATLVLWTAGGMGGSAVWVLLADGWLAIGASAANFALAGALLRIAWSAPRSRGLTHAAPPPSRPLVTLLVAALLLLPLLLFPRAGHISHLGGLLVGFLAVEPLRPTGRASDRTRTLGGIAVVALAVVLVAALGAAVRPERGLEAGAQILEQPDLPPGLVLGIAGSLAERPGATSGQLERARTALEAARTSLEGAEEDLNDLRDALGEVLGLVESRLGTRPRSAAALSAPDGSRSARRSLRASGPTRPRSPGAPPGS